MDTSCFLDVNMSTIIHYGYSRDEFLSMTLKDIRPPEGVFEKDIEEGKRNPG